MMMCLGDDNVMMMYQFLYDKDIGVIDIQLLRKGSNNAIVISSLSPLLQSLSPK